jgi:hypothetical protein
MKYTEIGNIMNYLPSALKKQIADDDQIFSWTAQAYRKLNNIKHSFVKDIVFLEVKNHKAKLPTDHKRTLAASVLIKDPTYEELTALCETIVLPANNSFANPCPISYAAFTCSDFYKNNWQILSHVGNTVDDYLCRITPEFVNHVYSTTPGSDILTFDFLEGTVAIEYLAIPKNNFGDMILPELPEVMWQYLASFVKMMYWENERFLGTQGALREYTEYKIEQAGYYTNTKVELGAMNYDILTAREQILGPQRFIKLPTVIHRLHSDRNINDTRSILQ